MSVTDDSFETLFAEPTRFDPELIKTEVIWPLTDDLVHANSWHTTAEPEDEFRIPGTIIFDGNMYKLRVEGEVISEYDEDYQDYSRNVSIQVGKVLKGEEADEVVEQMQREVGESNMMSICTSDELIAKTVSFYQFSTKYPFRAVTRQHVTTREGQIEHFNGNSESDDPFEVVDEMADRIGSDIESVIFDSDRRKLDLVLRLFTQNELLAYKLLATEIK